LLKPKGSIDARQYAAAFVTQCKLSLNDWEGSWAGLCQYGFFVMFWNPNAKILTEVSEKSYTPKNPVRRQDETWGAGVNIHTVDPFFTFSVSNTFCGSVCTK